MATKTKKHISKDEIHLMWKVHTTSLLKEMVECNDRMGIFKIPISIFTSILEQLAQRAIEINDDKLNAIMCRLTLYEEADPSSKEYDKEKVKEVMNRAYGNKKKK